MPTWHRKHWIDTVATTRALLNNLAAALTNRTANIGVVGLGYAGLPVAVAFAEAGFAVIGVDLDRGRVDAIEKGTSYLADFPTEQIGRLRGTDNLRATSDFDGLAACDVVVICVPTPLKDHQPDLTAVEESGKDVSKVLKTGALVVFESTSYPGTTEEVLLPILALGGRKVGEDFHLAFSPERIDPGNTRFTFRQIPKVVGGVTPSCTELASLLYASVVDEIVKVSSPKEAELAKLLENTYRSVNIALVNELSIYANDLGIDVWEAIDAAASKPFGFMAFYPGPGVGGHCIGIDPSYLSWRVKQTQGHAFRFIELADELNRAMPRFVVNRIGELLNDVGKPFSAAKILIVGVAYKSGIEDVRESPSLHVINLLKDRGTEIEYHDPMVDSLHIGKELLHSVQLDQDSLAKYDLVTVITPQPGVDYPSLIKHSRMVFDTRNALGKIEAANVVRL